MKTIQMTIAITVLFLIFAFKPPLPGETDKSGLYLTHTDFLDSKLSYATPAERNGNKIRISQGLFGSATVNLIYNGKKEVFALNQVYGYRDTKGQDYRFFGSEVYRILDTTGFYLYSISKWVKGEKIARPQLLYYFSTKPDGDLQRLTRNNLENAFAGNSRFRYSVESFWKFDSDEHFADYDEVLKTYKIKYLYIQSLQ